LRKYINGMYGMHFNILFLFRKQIRWIYRPEDFSRNLENFCGFTYATSF